MTEFSGVCGAGRRISCGPRDRNRGGYRPRAGAGRLPRWCDRTENQTSPSETKSESTDTGPRRARRTRRRRARPPGRGGSGPIEHRPKLADQRDCGHQRRRIFRPVVGLHQLASGTRCLSTSKPVETEPGTSGASTDDIGHGQPATTTPSPPSQPRDRQATRQAPPSQPSQTDRKPDGDVEAGQLTTGICGKAKSVGQPVVDVTNHAAGSAAKLRAVNQTSRARPETPRPLWRPCRRPTVSR